jgi:hypothetical protein
MKGASPSATHYIMVIQAEVGRCGGGEGMGRREGGNFGVV